MSRQYEDPYYAPEHRNYNPQQPYTDAPFDPYNTQQAHPTYDQSGYHDDDAYRNANLGDRDGLGHSREKSEFDNGFSTLRPPKPAGGVRIWRKDHHGPLWTAGGRGKCVFRFCCCSILIFLFLVISIVLTLGMWIRPPNITINQVGLNSTGASAVSVSSSTLKINFAVNISVDNPNYFTIDFEKIKVNLTYPTNDMDLGGGEKDDVDFHSDTQTTFNFPFALEYDLSEDTSQTVLKDLLSKCGITGTKEDITIDFKISLGLKILFVTVSPSFSNSFNFECPTDEIESFLQSSGLGSIASLT